MPIAVFLMGLSLVVFAGGTLWLGWRDDVSARNEYADLRSNFESSAELPSGEPTDARIDMSYFSAINPDFVGWIAIGGTSVSYPVVQGQDNEQYLGITFQGERNPAGSVFMDYRMRQAFDTPITMLHGHNMRDHSMFAPLPQYLDPTFLADHLDITIVTADGRALVYEVFHARRTTAWDQIYTLSFNDTATIELFETAPDGTRQILLLSTCTSDGDRSARVLVYAALRGEAGV